MTWIFFVFLWFRRGRVAARNGAIRAVWIFLGQNLDLTSSPFSHTGHEASCRRHRCITRSTASLEVGILVRFLVMFWPLQWEKWIHVNPVVLNHFMVHVLVIPASTETSTRFPNWAEQQTTFNTGLVRLGQFWVGGIKTRRGIMIGECNSIG